MPREWRDVWDISDVIGHSEKTKWLLKGTHCDSDMLATVDINDAIVPHDHMVMFSDRIVKLMKEVEKWYKEDECDR